MTKTKEKTQQPPGPMAGPVAGPAPVSMPGARLVLKCRCGGLYLNPDAHHDSFGHRPEPVAA